MTKVPEFLDHVIGWGVVAAAAGAVALLLLMLITVLTGCAMVPDGPRSAGIAQAYNVTGPEISISEDGVVSCKTPDPVNQPCSAQYAGGWEAMEPVVKILALPFEAAVQLVGRSVFPME